MFIKDFYDITKNNNKYRRNIAKYCRFIFSRVIHGGDNLHLIVLNIHLSALNIQLNVLNKDKQMTLRNYQSSSEGCSVASVPDAPDSSLCVYIFKAFSLRNAADGRNCECVPASFTLISFRFSAVSLPSSSRLSLMRKQQS